MKAKRNLAGQVALVTGGGPGMGRAVALALSARGVKVLVTGRSERELGETVGEIVYGGGKGRHLPGDVTNVTHLEAAMDRAIAEFGSLDIVVAAEGHRSESAAAAADVTVGDDLGRARATIETHLVGVYCTFHAALARMTGPGRLVALGGEPGSPAYEASKAGVVGLVAALAPSLHARGVTANVVVPRSLDDDAAVGELVAFLCGPAGDAITGQVVHVGAAGEPQ